MSIPLIRIALNQIRVLIPLLPLLPLPACPASSAAAAAGSAAQRQRQLVVQAQPKRAAAAGSAAASGSGSWWCKRSRGASGEQVKPLQRQCSWWCKRSRSERAGAGSAGAAKRHLVVQTPGSGSGSLSSLHARGRRQRGGAADCDPGG